MPAASASIIPSRNSRRGCAATTASRCSGVISAKCSLLEISLGASFTRQPAQFETRGGASHDSGVRIRGDRGTPAEPGLFEVGQSTFDRRAEQDFHGRDIIRVVAREDAKVIEAEKDSGGRARVLPPHEEDSTSDLESRIESHLPCLVAARGRRTKARLDRRVCIGRYRRCLVRPGSRHAPTDAAPAMSPHQ